MGRLFFGVVLGALLVGTGLFVWQRSDGCFGRCGVGTQCAERLCVVASPTAAPTSSGVAKERRRHHSTASGGGDSPAAPAEEQLKPGDEKMVAQGDALGRPEAIDLTKSSDDDGKELAQEDLDRVLHGADSPITKCISDAAGAAPLDGKIEVGLRVEKSGAVSRVRVEAPALLQRHGLTKCIHSAVTGLHFPASGGASVATYPFELK